MHDTTVRFSRSAEEVGGGTLRWMVRGVGVTNSLFSSIVNQAPELVFGKQFGGDMTENASHSMSEMLSQAKDSDSTSKTKLCKETDVYALGMVSNPKFLMNYYLLMNN